MRYQAGHQKIGGRQRGTPNKATVALRDFAREFLESDEYRQKLKDRILRGEAPKMEELLHHYGYGKPRDVIDDSGQYDGWVSPEEMKRAADETRAMLARSIAGQGREGTPGEPH